MSVVDEAIDIAREVSGIEWQACEDTHLQESYSDYFTKVIRPVRNPSIDGEWVLVFILGDPEEGKMKPHLRTYTVRDFEGFLDWMAVQEEHDSD